MAKKVIIVIVFLLVLAVVGIGIYIFLRPDEAVLQYYRMQDTPQNIGSRDDLKLGEITDVKDDHFFVKFSDGKTYEYVVIKMTKYENGEKKDLKKGKKVAVIGSYDEDGTYIAKIVNFNATSALDLIKKN